MSKEGIFDGFDAIVGELSGGSTSTAKGVTSIGSSSSIGSRFDEDTEGSNLNDGTDLDKFEGEDEILRQISSKRSKSELDGTELKGEEEDEIIEKQVQHSKVNVKFEDEGEELDGEGGEEEETETEEEEVQTSGSDLDGIGDGGMFGDAEPELVEYVQEQLLERLGVEDEEVEFKSFDDITEYIEKTIEERSVPTYANKEIENLDQFIRNGGNVSQYISQAYQSADVLSADLSDVEAQKEVIREDLRIKGMKEERINKRIERMEDTDILLEEAEDALESLQEHSQLEQERLVQEQEKTKKEAVKAQKAFVKGIREDIENMKDVRGFPISKAEKDKLFDYMLTPTESGIPQYYIDYKSKRKNMIESAFFTMKGDKLKKSIETKATSKAAKKLQSKLADKGRRGVNQRQSAGKANLNEALSLFSNALG